jgi:ATP-dependent exoDNAse (exonuclease V) beta subunit
MTTILKFKRPSIDIVGASAGTGKTTRLAGEFIGAVNGSETRPPIDPTRIVVCTFTNKAADELAARIRQRLLQAGNVDAAQLVLAGYVGTVNGICGRLLKDYALECGLSPEQNVIPEHMQNHLFAIASASVLDAFAQRIEPVAARLSFNDTASKSKYNKRTHWMDHVRNICTLARANGMSSDSLRESAKRSWQGIQRHLGRVDERIDVDGLDDQLGAEVDKALHDLERTNDQTGTTAKALDELRDCAGRARRDALTWRDWACLQKLAVGAKSKSIVKPVLDICAALPHHPRLHSDLKTYITEVFECAAESLDAYQQFKMANGLVDFVDQEYLALKLLDNPAVRESLKSRLDLALIDEFQDTSPIQLALFLKLADIVQHSIWVGDVKQAIYGFRGTDPQLMQQASELFNKQPPLEMSYRSRPELVEFSNQIFRRVFPTYGISEEDVVIRPSGKRVQSQKHTIELWTCDGVKLEHCFKSMACAVTELFNSPDPVMIDDPHSGITRKLRGSDVAILCRKNDHCSELASALANVGLKVAMTRDGLLDTPECLLAIATLRYLVDPYDRIALGHIIHLMTDYKAVDQSDWLTRWLNSGGKPDTLLKHKPQLEKARTQLSGCTTSDALTLAITAGRVLEMVEGWGNVPQRLSNLDALRGLVRDYEDTCAMARTSATINGFLSYLEHLEESDQPASVDADAVQVLTYHASKGLEWPFVILTDLDAEAAPKVHKDLCRIYVESGDEEFDINDPLKGRWIRFWPWAFGTIEKDLFFEPRASNSPEFSATVIRSRAENTRLMYVGITRARDVLVLAPYTGRTKNATGTQWLEELCCDDKPVLRLPKDETDTAIWVGDSQHHAVFRSFNPDNAAVAIEQSQVYSPKKPTSTEKTSTPYFVRPSSLSTSEGLSDAQASAAKVIDLGGRIAMNGKVEMNLLGDCVHSFLAADDHAMPQQERLELADRVRKLWQIEQISSQSLLEMSDRLNLFLQESFGTTTTYKECPVAARIEQQRLRGTIDLLVETDSAFHIIDHKSFPAASMEQWVNKALTFAPQLSAYRQAIAKSATKPVERLLIHMPIVGKIVDLTAVVPALQD